jgi:hypothetical protein
LTGIDFGEDGAKMAGLHLAIDLYKSSDPLAIELLVGMLAQDPWLRNQFLELGLEVAY